MAYITIRKQRIQNQLTRIDAQLTILYNTLSSINATENESYSFDSGEGSQRTTRRKIEDVQNQIERLESEYDHYLNELYGMGLVNIQLRRKRP